MITQSAIIVKGSAHAADPTPGLIGEYQKYCKNTSFLHFRTLAAIFEFYMPSQKPRRYLKTFLEPVALFSQSMSPFRATATPFIPNITTFTSSITSHNPQKISSTTHFSLWADLGNFSHLKFGDPSKLLRNALVYRHFINRKFTYCTVGELGES